MKTETFNAILAKALEPDSCRLETLTTAATCLNMGNRKVARHACLVLIALAQEVGEKHGLNLKALANTTLVEKAKEYACGGDRLYNFRNNYDWQNGSEELRLIGYLEKQMVSCADILSGKLMPSEELIKEKFGDVLNYSCLLYALISEKLEPQE